MGKWLRRIVAVSSWLVLAWAPAWAGMPDTVLLREALFSAGDAAPVPVALPHRWEDTVPGYGGVARYRLRLDTPAGGPDGPWGGALLAVYIERACSSLQVHLNGELLGGAPDWPLARDCYRPQLIPLPRSLLRPAGNVLELRLVGDAAQAVVSRQRAGGLSPVELGPIDTLEPRYQRQLFWNVGIAQMAAVLLGAVGLGAVALSAVRRQGGRLLYYGLYAMGWSLVSTRLFARSLPLPPGTMEILTCSLMGATFCCAYVLLLRLVDRRWPRLERLLWIQSAVTPLLLAAAAPHHLLTAAQALYGLWGAQFLACSVFFFRTAWRGHRTEFWVIGTALAATAVMASVELAIQSGLLLLPGVQLQHFMVPVVATVTGLHLLRQFAAAMRRTEEAKALLEQRVAEKSREIEDNWRQIAQLRAAEAAQGERRRIASDLHDDLGARLLSITQASTRPAHSQDPERIAVMARQALDEMRLAVRGMTAEPARATDVLADWRAECVARLDAAGVQAYWQAGEAPAPGSTLPSRVQVQCTRVLREAVSNVIRHSGATRCEIRIAWTEGGLLLEVRDDGRGLVPSHQRSGEPTGHGLASIESRIRALAGWHRFEPEPGGGMVLRAWVPVGTPSATIDTV